jgi:hypothetical protein
MKEQDGGAQDAGNLHRLTHFCTIARGIAEALGSPSPPGLIDWA